MTRLDTYTSIGQLAMKWTMTPQGQWVRIPFIRFPDGSDKPAIPERIIPKEQTNVR